MDAQRALLDALMGSSRNLTDEEKKEHREVGWDDPDVCAAYMARFCPHDLFINTKSNLGTCPKIHDPVLKQSFEDSPRYAAVLPKFEAELAHRCEKLVLDLDRKIRRGRDRLAQEVELPPPAHGDKSEQLSMLQEKIKKLLEQIEQLGETGKIDEATALMRMVDVLNLEKAALVNHAENKALMVPQEKKMELCEQCGSFLVTNDVLERTQSHVTGKQHIGYGLVREFLAEYKAAREEERLAREKEAEERHNHRERGGYHNVARRDEPRERSREHERDRYCERHRDRYDHGGRGSSDYRSGSYNNRRDYERERHRDSRNGDARRNPGRMRSRSRSPGRHGY